jgi:hypothetical protein
VPFAYSQPVVPPGWGPNRVQSDSRARGSNLVFVAGPGYMLRRRLGSAADEHPPRQAPSSAETRLSQAHQIANRRHGPPFSSIQGHGASRERVLTTTTHSPASCSRPDTSVLPPHSTGPSSCSPSLSRTCRFRVASINPLTRWVGVWPIPPFTRSAYGTYRRGTTPRPGVASSLKAPRHPTAGAGERKRRGADNG